MGGAVLDLFHLTHFGSAPVDTDVYVWVASCLSGERRGKQFLLTIRYPFLRPPLPPSEVSPTCTVASSTEVV